MILLDRPAEPRVLARNKAKWLAKLKSATTDAAKKKAEGKYRNPGVKRTLIAMCNSKCAYCESKILHVDYGDIEHFKPKSNLKYVDLTFEWQNLLLSCKVCNGRENKGTEFPEASDGGPPIDPSLEDPSQHLHFFYDPMSGIATVIPKSERGRITSNLFGLNRPFLRSHRSTFLKKLVALKRLGAEDKEVQQLLLEACRKSAEYSAFARNLVAEVTVQTSASPASGSSSSAGP